jgi:hypothetical protein
VRIYKPPTTVAAVAALLFGLSGLFASLAATIIPTIIRTWAWVAYPLFFACILIGAWILYASQRPGSRPSALQEEYEPYLIHYGSAAASIRLVGAADEWFPHWCVHVEASQDTYALPDDCLAFRDEVIARLQAESAAHKWPFFDGPNTRLVDYTATPVDASEQKHLRLVLGPVGWYDYSVTHWYLRRLLAPLDRERLRKYIDLDNVALSGSVRTNRFTNILCTATTVITADGFVTYSRRSERVSAQRMKYTSCIAENIHQDKDRSLRVDSKGLPVPYRTVLRGIEEELSPLLADWARSNPRHLVLLGMDFDLESFHPDLLFLLAWPGHLQEIESMIKDAPGRDYGEGSMLAVRMKRTDIVGLLDEPMWVPGGKASVIRAVEYIEALRLKHRSDDLISIFSQIGSSSDVGAT